MGEPATIAVPLVGSSPETILINALEFVMAKLNDEKDPDNWSQQIRAADWLHSKYGSKP